MKIRMFLDLPKNHIHSPTWSYGAWSNPTIAPVDGFVRYAFDVNIPIREPYDVLIDGEILATLEEKTDPSEMLNTW